MAGRPKRKQDFALLTKTGEDLIFDQIASGASLRDLCAAHSVSMGSLHAWLTSPERSERYSRVRVERAGSHAAKIEQLADDVEAGKTAPDVARVSIDARKWLASRMDPKTYGDKQGPLVNIQLTDLHLGSLRKVVAEPAIQAIEDVD